jgi:hypothetical protein
MDRRNLREGAEPSFDVLDYPLKVTYSDSMGVHLVASRDIIKGECVLKECPLALALSDEYKRSYCNICSAKLISKKERSGYLCEDCSANNYLVDMFNFFKNSGVTLHGKCEVSLYTMFFRLFLNYGMRRYNFLDEDVLAFEQEAIRVLAWDHLAVNQDLEGDISQIAKVISTLFTEFNYEYVSNACRAVVCNQHAVSDEDGNDIGRAIFCIGAMFNHSCDANVSWEISNSTFGIMSCVANRDIAAGEELTISYISDRTLRTLDDKNRFSKLLCELQFACSCVKCGSLCKNCFKNAKSLKVCSKCKSVQYCSRDCQVDDWKTHKVYCAQFSQGKIDV